MATPIVVEIREAAVGAYLQGEGTREAVALRYGMSVGSLTRFLEMRRKGSLLPKKTKRGPSSLLNVGDLEVLRELAMDSKVSLEQLAKQLLQRTGKKVSPSTVQRRLRTMRVVRKQPEKKPQSPKTSRSAVPKEEHTSQEPIQQPKKPSEPTRYTKDHRRDPKTGYPSDLFDAEWQLIKGYFTKRTRDFDHSPRRILEGIFYVLRSGCAWRMLPHDFPPWETVYAAFRRWTNDGRLAACHDALRRQFRRQVGKNEQPSASIIDSQSVKTTEKGDPEDMMAARRSTDESDILS